MSGPIVRKYGFPNFEKIFGERPLQHGADEEAKPEEPSKAGEQSEAQRPEKKPTGEAPGAGGK